MTFGQCRPFTGDPKERSFTRLQQKVNSDDDENYEMSISLQDEVKSSYFGQVNIDLDPGTVLLLDNWRVTHSRTAYTGHRWALWQFAQSIVDHAFCP